MMDVPVRPRPVVGIGVLLVGLFVSACTFGGASEPAEDSPEEAASVDTTATAVPASLPQPAATDQAPPAPPSSNDARSVAQQLSDASVEARIKRALVAERSLRLFDFRPEVIEGHAILRGDVNTRDQYRRAQRVARDVEGVEVVTNELTVEGQSVTDDESSEAQAEASTESEEESTGVYYTVQRGDTLWEIARQHETSVRQLRSLNDLHSSSLNPGERIRVR